jgi:predicted transcriptional regulator of viral defense system
MQPIRQLMRGLMQLASAQRYIFAPHDLRSLVSELSDSAFRTLLSRAVSQGYLSRPCRGIYLYEPALQNDGLILYRIAARLRVNDFNYISLETALSDTGVISQIPLGRIMVMSSGRSNIISCGRFGEIEFIHTSRTATELARQLHYDSRCGMWRASTELALRDMTVTHRSTALINEEFVNESI